MRTSPGTDPPLFLARHGERARDPLRAGVRSEELQHDGHLLATLVGGALSLLGLAFAHVSLPRADLEARGTNRGSGGADRRGGGVADSVPLELPISVLAAEVLAEPAEDGGHCVGFWGRFSASRFLELAFRV